MKKHNRIAGLFIVALSLAIMYYSAFTLRLGTLRNPNSGFVPFVCATVMLGCAIVYVLANLGADENPQPLWAQGAWKRPLLAVLLLLGYALLFEPLGYVVSTLAFAVAWQAIVERANWKVIAIFGVTSTLFMWALFEKLLRVPLPGGILR